MRVLQLGPYPPPEGGINRNMLAIRRELLSQGHRCTIIVTSRSTSETDQPDVLYPRTAFELLRLLASLEYDILHLHVGGNITTRVLALVFVCGLFGRGRNVLSFHSGGYPETKEARAAKPPSIRGFVFRRFSRIIAVSSTIVEVFKRYGVGSEKIRVIFPFVQEVPDESVTIPTKLRDFISTHKPFLLTVGLLEEEYGLLTQIEAMRGVLKQFPDAGLMIVGSGSWEGEIKSAINSTAYADRVFVAGDVEHAITLHLIDKCDIMLRTTLYDGDAISVREALFLDRPVIATDNGTRPDGVSLIPMSDPAALAAEIVSLAVKESSVMERKLDDNGNIKSVLALYAELVS